MVAAKRCTRVILPTILAVLAPSLIFAQRGTPPSQPVHRIANPAFPPELARESRAAVARGLVFLKSTQDKKGGWTARFGPAITAIAAQAFAQSPDYGPQHPIVRRALAHVLTFAQSDGGIYQPEMNIANYQTSVVLMMLSSLRDPALGKQITASQDFLRTLQYDDPENLGPASTWYGGAGYKSKKRPDLSNTQMMLEALHQSGLSADDPVYRKALTFIARCQMSGETNDQPFARKSDDGGFIYTPVDGGESKADTFSLLGKPQLRTYGSMTYAAFKSMLYAKVDRNDPRVQKALRWIRGNWTLEGNPNMPADRAKEGLFYYYHVFAKSLRAWGQPVIVDDRGAPHAWRIELCRKLLALQNKDGSWVNPASRWEEGDANYVTALAILTMQEAMAE